MGSRIRDLCLHKRSLIMKSACSEDDTSLVSVFTSIIACGGGTGEKHRETRDQI